MSGKALVCHCKEGQRCHGDEIIKAFEEEAKSWKGPTADGAEDSGDEDDGNLGKKHKAGDGPRGRGPPMMVLRKGEARELVDGGGLCSPGKWQLDKRVYEDNQAVRDLRSALEAAEEKAVRRLEEGGGSDRKLVYTLAAGAFRVHHSRRRRSKAAEASSERFWQAIGCWYVPAGQTWRKPWT